MANYRVNLKYNTQRDAELIRRLESQENKQDYIRRLIMSDIAADGLRGLLTLQDDVEQGRTNDRIRFWEEHCPASVDPGDTDPCSSCKYYGPFGLCSLEEEWEAVKKDYEILKAFNSGNTHAVYEPVNHDVESFDPALKQEENWKKVKQNGKV